MSAPAPEGTAVPKEKKGLRNVLSRVKSVFKGDRDPSKRRSTVSAKADDPASAAGLLVTASTSQAAPAPAAPERVATPANATRVPKSQLFEERARKLAERYGLDIKPSEWHTSTEGDVFRVEKPIRMRVRRYCHVCDQAFGPAKECPGCQHGRCRECARYPPKLSDAQLEDQRRRRAAKQQELRDDPPIVPDWDYDAAAAAKEPVLRRPGRPGGPDHVYKRPRQRVRRSCHQCGALFLSGSRTCESCSHVRCTDCPRDPPKRDKYPYGYPGDEFGPGAVPHYTCHECRTVFAPDPPDGVGCSNCGHRRCTSCRRLTPHKVVPEPDPEVWERVQARIRELRLEAAA